jgi:20S proteasome alpha/beta subunit
VTIAAGLQLEDGILLCKDTNHKYFGAMKLHSTKIFSKDYPSGLKTAFCIVGEVRYCKMIVQKWERRLAEIPAEECDRKKILSEIENTLIASFRHHIFSHPRFLDERMEVQFLFSVWSPIDGLGMYSTQDTAINELYGYECLGSGSYLGHYLIRPLYLPGSSLNRAVLLATHALLQVKNYDDACGGDSQFVVLRHDGTASDVEHFDISQNEKYSQHLESMRSLIFYDVPDLDRTDIEFKTSLAIYEQSLISMREDLKNEKSNFKSLLAALSGLEESGGK